MSHILGPYERRELSQVDKFVMANGKALRKRSIVFSLACNVLLSFGTHAKRQVQVQHINIISLQWIMNKYYVPYSKKEKKKASITLFKKRRKITSITYFHVTKAKVKEDCIYIFYLDFHICHCLRISSQLNI